MHLLTLLQTTLTSRHPQLLLTGTGQPHCLLEAHRLLDTTFTLLLTPNMSLFNRMYSHTHSTTQDLLQVRLINT